MTYREIINKAADAAGLDRQTAHRVYKAYWKAIKEHIESLPLKDDLTDDGLARLRPNVSIPSIGKLHVTVQEYRRIKDNYSKYKKK